LSKVGAVLALALLTLGCGKQSDPGPAPPPEAERATPAREGAVRGDTLAGDSVGAEAAPDTAWTAGVVDLAPAAAGVATLGSVRAARHDGFDRVVWELSGPAPAVHVEYVDRPVRQCGSGEPVPLPGDAWLEVRLEPAVAHTEAGRPTMDERRAEPGLPVVLELVQTCDFEAVVVWTVAVRSPERFRVRVLADPTRVVVDLRHGTR
jgi:hypothetical protein